MPTPRKIPWELEKPFEHVLRAFWPAHAVQDFDSAYKMLRDLHNEEHRVYHTWGHVLCLYEDLLTIAQHMAILNCNVQPICREIVFAMAYHDAIYRIGANDNEWQSSILFLNTVGRYAWSGDTQHMINLTKSHRMGRCHDKNASHQPVLSNIFLDLDMEILSRPWDEFLAYREQIRQEYKEASDSIFNRGSMDFFYKLITNGPIYHTIPFLLEKETQARININRFLKGEGT